MDTQTSHSEDILIISDEPVCPHGSRKRIRVVRWIGISGVVALIAWVTSLVVESVVRESRLKTCANQLGQLGLAMLEYQKAHDQFPAPAIADPNGKALLSWRVRILPYLGYQSLYDRFHLDERWDSPHNLSLLGEMPSEFACPGGSARRNGRTGYVVIVGPEMDAYSTNTAFEPTRGVDIRSITDGTSGTILVLETDLQLPWTKPDDLKWAKGAALPRLASPHTGGAHALLADGAAKFLKSTIDPRILEGLFTINGGEVLSAG